MLRWIRLRETLSGGRCDGRPWPPGGELIDVPDWEAEHAVNAGWAYYDDPPAPPEPEVVPGPVRAQAAPAQAEAVAPVRQPDPEDEHDRLEAVADGTEEPEVPEPPRPSDPKQDWVDYAADRGMDPEKAAAMSKADLMSRYGGRL